MRKQYTSAFKAKVVLEMLREEKSVNQIASEHGVHPSMLHKWKAAALKGLPSLLEEQDDQAQLRATHEKEVEALYLEIGKLSTQLAWLKRKSGLEHAGY